MQRSLKLQGFPEMSDKIELPNIATLINMPWFQYADIDDVYKYGGETARYLLSKTPLSFKKKYTLIANRVQYLNPSRMSIKYVGRWHTDSSGYPLASEEDDTVHLLISKCTAITQFNTVPVELAPFDIGTRNHVINHYMEENKDKLGLIARDIEPERFVTFDHRHAHRAVQAKEEEFRFMWRVIESDKFAPISYPQCSVDRSYSYNEKVDETANVIDAIEQTSEYYSILKKDGRIIIQS